MPANQNRFKISFDNANRLRSQSSLFSAGRAVAPAPVAAPVALNAPMIDRVHKTRPGCSACGKKVV